MKFLITGATGFIGRNMVSFLLQKGHSVKILTTRDTLPDYLNHPSIEVHKGDLTQPQTLEGLGENCEIVIHLAAKVSDWGSKKSFYEAIYQGTQHLLEATFRKINRFVYVSSIAACGINRHLDGFNENSTCLQTGMAYGDAKLETEELVRDYARNYNIPITIARPGSVIGPDSVWVNEPIKLMKSLSGLPLVDQGKHPAALIDVENLVNGLYLAATLPQAIGETYFLVDEWEINWKDYFIDLGKLAGSKPRGSVPYGLAYSLGSLSEKIFTPLGIRPPMTRLGAAVVGRNLMVSTEKAKTELGWESAVNYEESMKRIKDFLKFQKEKILLS